MGKKGFLTTTSPLKWHDFQNLKARLLLDLESINNPQKKVQHAKFLLLITIGCYTGLRIGDILKLQWDNIVEKQSLVINEQKTGNVRNISMNANLISMIEKMFYVILPDSADDYIFSNNIGIKPISVQYVNTKLKMIFNQYGIRVKNPSSHTLRKTFGRRVFESNHKSDEALILLSHMFNHTSSQITRRYIGLQEERIRNVYLSL